jgi:hypothetical protein
MMQPDHAASSRRISAAPASTCGPSATSTSATTRRARGQHMLHLHRLQHRQPVAPATSAPAHEDRLHQPRHRRLDPVAAAARSRPRDVERIETGELVARRRRRPRRGRRRAHRAVMSRRCPAAASPFAGRSPASSPMPPRPGSAPVHPPPRGSSRSLPAFRARRSAERRPEAEARFPAGAAVEPHRGQRGDRSRRGIRFGAAISASRSRSISPVSTSPARSARAAPAAQEGEVRHRAPPPRSATAPGPAAEAPRPASARARSAWRSSGRTRADLIARAHAAIGPRALPGSRCAAAPWRAGSPSARPRHRAAPRPRDRDRGISCPIGSGSPAATRSCHSTRSTPVIRLGHGMLDLQPRVHLHEVEPVGAQPVEASTMNSTVPAPE